MNLNTRYRLNKRLTLGVNLNLNGGNNSSFFFWKADSLKYSPFPGTVSKNQPLRFNIDPHLTYYDGSGNRHKLLSRYLKVENRVSNGRSNFSEQYYLEYQFQRNIKAIDLNVTAGAVYIGSDVEAELYGDTTFHSRNLATYIDFEKRFGTKLTVSAGFRYESNLINNPGFIYPGGVVEPSQEKEAKPVLRLGANYQIGDYSFLRASWGQGYRFPTIAEKFIFTNLGGFNISPNPDLQSETGWSTELGIKQGLKLGSLKGFLD
ncbi:MAG: TonB-dependent receptor [Haliscomenobacter sp.]|nr:TonB-dependent receptor [Haliscomenobacter sp.]MBK9488675.1 TonB-dependent receptor [Haliscomenobacter sp.]